MRIGIAITTYKRPKHLENCLNQIRKHTPLSTLIYVSDDSINRKGIAYRKTDCIDVLWKAGCDYFFLFDDDCFPIADGWMDHFINASVQSKQEHFCYGSEGWIGSVVNDIIVGKGLAGVLLFLTRAVVSKVGGFMAEYSFYSGEHILIVYTLLVLQVTVRTYGRSMHRNLYMHWTSILTYHLTRRYNTSQVCRQKSKLNV
jgi:hypothetical protein